MRFAILICIIASACAKPSGRTPAKDPPGGADAVDQTDPYFKFDDRPRVSRLELDEAKYRVYQVGVGKQDFMDHETPVVNFILPSLADYVQIIRCRSDVVLSGFTGPLENVELTRESIAEETRILKENDYWKKAATNQGCLLIAENYTENNFFDVSVRGGSYRYFVRACVDPRRMKDTDYSDTRNCSIQFGLSTPLKDYANRRLDKQSEALADAQKWKDAAEGHGRELYYVTRAMSAAMEECQRRQIAIAKKEIKFQAITNIVGAGIGIGASILAPHSLTDQVAETGGGIGAQTISVLGSNRNTGAGVLLAQSIASLFHKPPVTPDACTMADKLQRIGNVVAVELENDRAQYLSAMENVAALAGISGDQAVPPPAEEEN